MVQEFDAEDLTGFGQSLRDAAVFGTGSWVAARVVVGDDDRGSAGGNGVFVLQSNT